MHIYIGKYLLARIIVDNETVCQHSPAHFLYYSYLKLAFSCYMISSVFLFSNKYVNRRCIWSIKNKTKKKRFLSLYNYVHCESLPSMSIRLKTLSTKCTNVKFTNKNVYMYITLYNWRDIWPTYFNY